MDLSRSYSGLHIKIKVGIGHRFQATFIVRNLYRLYSTTEIGYTYRGAFIAIVQLYRLYKKSGIDFEVLGMSFEVVSRHGF